MYHVADTSVKEAHLWRKIYHYPSLNVVNGMQINTKGDEIQNEDITQNSSFKKAPKRPLCDASAFLVSFVQLFTVCWNERATHPSIRLRGCDNGGMRRRLPSPFPTQSSHFILFPSPNVPIVTTPMVRCLGRNIYCMCYAAETAIQHCSGHSGDPGTEISPSIGDGGPSPLSHSFIKDVR